MWATKKWSNSSSCLHFTMRLKCFTHSSNVLLILNVITRFHFATQISFLYPRLIAAPKYVESLFEYFSMHGFTYLITAYVGDGGGLMRTLDAQPQLLFRESPIS